LFQRIKKQSQFAQRHFKMIDRFLKLLNMYQRIRKQKLSA
jgi:hypothetical protein